MIYNDTNTKLSMKYLILFNTFVYLQTLLTIHITYIFKAIYISNHPVSFILPSRE